MPLSKIQTNSTNTSAIVVKTGDASSINTITSNVLTVNTALSTNTSTGNVSLGFRSITTAVPSRLSIYDDTNHSDSRYISTVMNANTTYNPASYGHPNKIVTGLRYGWYEDHYTTGILRSADASVLGWGVARSTGSMVNFQVNSVGIVMRGNGGSSPTYFRNWIAFQSAFDNPTVDLVNFQSGTVNNSMQIKVRVRQVPYLGSAGAAHNEHIGLASVWTNGSTHSTYVGTMVVTNGLTGAGGTGNVGTLSWSGSGSNTTLRYTANRASNYDSYFVEYEIVGNSGGNFTVNLYPGL